MSDALEIAERFFRAIEAGNVEAIRAIYAPDAVIWHNNDPLPGEATSGHPGRLPAAARARG